MQSIPMFISYCNPLKQFVLTQTQKLHRRKLLDRELNAVDWETRKRFRPRSTTCGACRVATQQHCSKATRGFNFIFRSSIIIQRAQQGVVMERGLTENPCNPTEIELLQMYRQLSPENQERVSGIVRGLVGIQG